MVFRTGFVTGTYFEITQIKKELLTVKCDIKIAVNVYSQCNTCKL